MVDRGLWTTVAVGVGNSARIMGMNATASGGTEPSPTAPSSKTARAQSPYAGAPYEDEDGYERRWGGLSESATKDLARSDPLTFVADHLPNQDRREGSVVVLLEPVGFGAPLLHVIADAPVNPSAEECYRLLWPFATAAAQACPPDGRAMIGVIHHRRGPAVPGLLDQRWLAAVRQAAEGVGIDVLGVLARTDSGALIPIADADAECA